MQDECESFQEFLKLVKARCSSDREQLYDHDEQGLLCYRPICLAAATALEHIESVKGKTTRVHFDRLSLSVAKMLQATRSELGYSSMLHTAYEVPMQLSQVFRHAVLDHWIQHPDLTDDELVVVCRNLATQIVHEHATHSTTK